MSYIIDGHNLIGVMPDIDLADPDDEFRLLERLRAYRAHASGRSLIVFFDSGDLPPGWGRALHPSHPSLSSPGIQVRFSGPGQTADDAIVAFLQSQTQPGQYAIVTNDRELSDRVRAVGASVIRSSDFARRLIARATHPSPAPPKPTPNPHAPAFADIYAGFIEAEKGRARFGTELHVSPEVWIERLYGDDVKEAQLAARWLGQYGGEHALSPLRDALTHGDARVRAAAALALGDLGDPAALPDLCNQLLKDMASIARQAAAQSLGRIGDCSVEPALENSAKADSKSKVRKAARAALAQIRARR